MPKKLSTIQENEYARKEVGEIAGKTETKMYQVTTQESMRQKGRKVLGKRCAKNQQDNKQDSKQEKQEASSQQIMQERYHKSTQIQIEGSTQTCTQNKQKANRQNVLLEEQQESGKQRIQKVVLNYEKCKQETL